MSLALRLVLALALIAGSAAGSYGWAADGTFAVAGVAVLP